MKKKIIYCLFFATVLLLFNTSSVQADVIAPGYRPPEYCFEITNLTDYPDYVFIVSVNGVMDQVRNGITPGYCFNIIAYFPDSLQLIAVPTAVFQPGDLNAKDKKLIAKGALFSNVVPYTEPGDVQIWSIVTHVTDQASLTLVDNQFTLTKDNVVFDTLLGSAVTKPYINQVVRPEYSGTGLAIVGISLIGLMLVSFLTLVVVVVRQRKQRRLSLTASGAIKKILMTALAIAATLPAATLADIADPYSDIIDPNGLITPSSDFPTLSLVLLIFAGGLFLLGGAAFTVIVFILIVRRQRKQRGSNL